ncbi:MAG TPA: SUMF1/EgtB/PvdO family nonheme iron enzyme [Sedimentisphaerales bacterium]|nr:SUMF1/EgtB/PvdO family nonheme iron enzyme [Sedimentisphaerales bacterium]
MTSRRIFVFVAIAAVCVVLTLAFAAAAAQNAPPKKYTETVTAKTGEKISLDMVLIPAGIFQMGSAADEPGRKDDEGPQHEICLDSFYLCSTETTIALFMAYYQETVSAKRDLLGMQEEKKQEDGNVDAITGPTPVYGDMTMGYNEKHPAIGMTWHSAMTFCRWLSQKTGKQYRLPTEAEWEYACRAGTTNVFGVTSDPGQIKDFAWFDATADNETSEVGKKKPNAWGLYDMSGNVREWVYDFYSPTAYQEAAKKAPAVNPKGPDDGQVHVARGGDYSCQVQELRCAARAFEETWWRSGDPQIPKSQWWLPEMDIIGFRVARSVDAGGKK